MVISPKKTWHMPILDGVVIGNLLKTLMNTERYQDNNSYIFTEVNQETMTKPPEGKNDVLKLRLVFSLNNLPESTLEGDLSQKF